MTTTELMPDVIAVVIAEDGNGGFFMRSPQIPGWSFGRPTRHEFNKDLSREVRWAVRNVLQTTEEFPVLSFFEHEFEAASGELCAVLTEIGPDREHAANALISALTKDPDAARTLNREPILDDMGRSLFVSLLSTDSLRVARTLLEPAAPSIRLNHAHLGPQIFFSGVELALTGGTSLESLGLSLDSTMQEVMDALKIGYEDYQGDFIESTEPIVQVRQLALV